MSQRPPLDPTRAVPHVKFLIDECSSKLMVPVAQQAGYVATTVGNQGWLGLGDPALLQHVRSGDWTLVTNNRADWLQLTGREPIHAGLVIIVPCCPPAVQVQLFTEVLYHLEGLTSIVNTVVEVESDLSLRRYELSRTIT